MSRAKTPDTPGQNARKRRDWNRAVNELAADPKLQREDSMTEPQDIMRDGQHFNPDGAWEKSFLRWLDGNPVTQRPEVKPVQIGGDGIIRDEQCNGGQK